MKIIVLDTETLGLDNPLIYDCGYVIYDTELKAKIKEKSYIIKQIFDNEQLFATAYYHKKRPLYIERLKSGYSKKVGWGSLVNYLKKDIEKYNIDFVGAYNSRFDYRAFDKTCSLYNKPNPLAKLDPVENDIMNFIHHRIINSFLFQLTHHLGWIFPLLQQLLMQYFYDLLLSL